MQLIKKEKKSFHIVSAVIMIALILLICVPVIIFSFLEIPATDDISNAYNMSNMINEYGGYFKAAVAFTARLYKGTSGYYSAAFLNFYFSPFLRGGITALRWSLAITNTIFFVSLYYLVHAFVGRYTHSLKIKVGLYICVLYFCVNNYLNSDIFVWYGGNIAYLLPISFMFVGLAMYIKHIDMARWYSLIIASICGIVASGSSLNVAALNCELYGVICALAINSDKELRKKIIIGIPFLASLIGGIVNLLSPGNYIRHDSVRATYNVIESIGISFSIVIKRIAYLVTYTPFLGYVIIGIVIGCMIVKKSSFINVKHRYPILLLLLVIVLVAIVDYPVILGYGGGYVPARCVFVQDLSIYVFTTLWMIYFCCYCNERGKKLIKTKRGRVTLSTVGVCLSLLACVNRGYTDKSVLSSYEVTSIYMIETLLDNSAVESSRYQENMYYEIINSDEADVVYYLDADRATNYLIDGMGLRADPGFYVNDALAKLYGKKSVVVLDEGD